MKFKSIAAVLTSLLLLAACETNPKIVELLNNGLQPNNSATYAQAQPIVVKPVQDAGPVATSKVVTSSNAPTQPPRMPTLTKPDRTGLIGKTVKAVTKFNKQYKGEMDYYNGYAVFGGGYSDVLPNATEITVLGKNWPNNKTAVIAYTKGPRSGKYFIDAIEVDLPKSHSIVAIECTGAHMALFKNSNSNSASMMHSPTKAWSVINEKITELSNIRMVTCADNSE